MDAIVVLRAMKTTADFFVESGDVKLVEIAASGADGQAREVTRGEYVTRSAAGAITTVGRAPKVFVDAMPRHFIDPVYVLAAKLKSPPVLSVASLVAPASVSSSPPSPLEQPASVSVAAAARARTSRPLRIVCPLRVVCSVGSVSVGRGWVRLSG